jgi:hypothetical protein
VDGIRLHGRHRDLDGAGVTGNAGLRPVSVPVPAVPRERGPAAADLHHPARAAGARAHRGPAVHGHLRGRRGHPGRLRADPESPDGAGHPARRRHRPGSRAPGAAGQGLGADRGAARGGRRVRRIQREAGRVAHQQGCHDDGLLHRAGDPGGLDRGRPGVRVRPVPVRIPAVPVQPAAAAADVRDHGRAAGNRALGGQARRADLPERRGRAARLRAPPGSPAGPGPRDPARRRARAARLVTAPSPPGRGRWRRRPSGTGSPWRSGRRRRARSRRSRSRTLCCRRDSRRSP